jgi:hypothetical protein
MTRRKPMTWLMIHIAESVASSIGEIPVDEKGKEPTTRLLIERDTLSRVCILDFNLALMLRRMPGRFSSMARTWTQTPIAAARMRRAGRRAEPIAEDEPWRFLRLPDASGQAAGITRTLDTNTNRRRWTAAIRTMRPPAEPIVAGTGLRGA